MPFKDFNPGDILTADDVDLIMRQGLPTVANQAARDAIPAPTEGMRVYRLDTHMIEQHSGAAWVPEDTGWVTAGAVTAQAGWSITSYAIRRVGKLVELRAEVARTGATLTASSFGDLPDTSVFVISAGWRINGGVPAASVSFMTAGTADGTGLLYGDGQLVIFSLSPTAQITTSASIYLSASWLLG